MPIRFNFKSFKAIENYVSYVVTQQDISLSLHRYMKYSPNKAHFYNTLNDAIELSVIQGNISREDSSVLCSLVNELFRFMPEIYRLEKIDMYNGRYGAIKEYPNNDAQSYKEKVHEAMESHFKVFRLAIRIYNKHGETLKNDPTMVTLLNSQYAASILGYNVSDDEYQSTIRAVISVTNTISKIEHLKNDPWLNVDTTQTSAQPSIVDSDDDQPDSPEPPPLGSSM